MVCAMKIAYTEQVSPATNPASRLNLLTRCGGFTSSFHFIGLTLLQSFPDISLTLVFILPGRLNLTIKYVIASECEKESNVTQFTFDTYSMLRIWPNNRAAIRVSQKQKEAAPTRASVRLFLLNAIACPRYPERHGLLLHAYPPFPCCSLESSCWR
jgi:hypothetical protein